MTKKPITGPPSVESPLLESERRFRALTEHGAHAVVLLNADGVVTYASPSTQQVLGYTPHEFEGQNVFAHMHPDEVGLLQSLFAHLLDHPGDHLTHEFRYRHKDGTWLWIEGTGTNLLHDPAVRALVANFADVTARKRAEEQLRFHARIAQNLPAAVIATDSQYRIVIWNEAAERLYGWTADEAEGGMATNPPIPSIEFLNHGERTWEEDLSKKCLWQGEVIQKRKDGTSFNALASVSVVKDDTGSVFGYVAVLRDITERKHMERQRAEQRFQGLLESAPDAIVATGPEGRIVLVNGQVEQLFGYHRDELLGQPVEILLPHHLHELHVQHRARYYTDPRTRPMGSGLELRARRKDDSEFPVEISLSPLVTDTETLVTAVIRDITERKRVEEERQRAEVAERAVRDRDEFLSVAAHELKTPLTSLSAFAQVLLRCLRNAGSVDPARLARALANIEIQAEKVNRLVDQLLDVTRLDAGRLVLEQRPTDLSGLIREVVEAAQAQTTQHTLVVQAPPVLCAWVDALRLEQVFTNLLSNAIIFSPQGGTITCTLSTDPGGDVVQVAVRDQGIGIPPEQRAHIFDRFYQAHATSYRSGLGLGLYISQQIVALHGGSLGAEFPPEGGSLFVIRLPRGAERLEWPAPGASEPLRMGVTLQGRHRGGRQT